MLRGTYADFGTAFLLGKMGNVLMFRQVSFGEGHRSYMSYILSNMLDDRTSFSRIFSKGMLH